MGANAEQSPSRIRIVTELISQPEWTDIVPMFDKSTSVAHDRRGGTGSVLVSVFPAVAVVIIDLDWGTATSTRTA